MYVLAALIIILILIFILLCIPLEIELFVSFRGKAACNLRFRYFFHLIRWEAAQKNREVTVTSQSGRMPPILDLLRVKGLAERVFILLKRTFRSISFKDVSSDIYYSLGEDHYTGLACGYLCATLPVINVITGSDLKIRPVFEDELKLEGHLQGGISLQPIRVAGPCLAFVCSGPVWQAGKIMMGNQ